MDKITDIADLEEHQKRWIVRNLAFYEKPKKVAEAFSEVYGREIDPDLVVKMQPGLNTSIITDEDLINLYFDERTRITQAIYKIPTVNKWRRLAVLDRLYNFYIEQNQVGKAMNILQIIQKEDRPIYEDLLAIVQGKKTVNRDRFEA